MFSAKRLNNSPLTSACSPAVTLKSNCSDHDVEGSLKWRETLGWECTAQSVFFGVLTVFGSDCVGFCGV